MLWKPNALGKLLKWVVKLTEFDIYFKTRAVIKGQALADFVAEFANVLKMEEVMEPSTPPTWNLFVNSSAKEIGLGAGVVLISPEEYKLNCAMKFEFEATNM